MRATVQATQVRWPIITMGFQAVEAASMSPLTMHNTMMEGELKLFQKTYGSFLTPTPIPIRFERSLLANAKEIEIVHPQV